jgi:Integrase core domain/Chromo (CHRromatin Organisation MOdifier) domain
MDEVLHMDFIAMGPGRDGYEYVLVIKDDASKFVWLLPARKADSATVADALLQWFASFGVCTTWVSDQGTHFLNSTIKDMQRALGTRHHFTTARCPWANGTVERVMKDLLRCVRALLSEWKWQPEAWPAAIPIVQMVLNQSPSPSMGNVSPITAMTGLAPMKLTDTIVLQPKPLKISSIQEIQELQAAAIQELQESMAKMHKAVQDKANQHRQDKREARDKTASAGAANFAVGDYVLYAEVWPESKHKLRSKWNGPAEVVSAESPWIYKIRHLITGDIREVHCTRLKFYADSSLNVTSEFIDQVAHNSEGHVVQAIKGHRYDKPTKQYEFLVAWKGLSKADDSWESAQSMIMEVPVLVKSYCQTKIKDPFIKRLVQTLNITLPGKSFRKGGVGTGIPDPALELTSLEASQP